MENNLNTVYPGPDLNPRQPKNNIPEGVIDCHCHVFDQFDRYPLAPNRSYTPARATLEQYLAMCKVVGIARTIQVNASTFGMDNSLTCDLIAQLGQDKARGVCGVAPDTPSSEIERLHHAGFRGARLSTHVKGYGGFDALPALAARIKPFGWHVQLHVSASAELAAIEAQLMQCPVPIVFDHLGGARGEEGVAAPGFQALLRMLKNRDDCWVKISSWYRRTDAAPPLYANMQPLAQALAATRPDRCVWGSNWPHPVWTGPMPNDG
ncbi:MAG TPA: amidohydrolase family protein, partial [Burkholderiales bacterium]|nr:amidohydrolase family protein [Burkholderiales bacterium]